MAESKRTFQSAKMDKDVDDRVLKPGNYRDALNVSVDFSEDGNVIGGGDYSEFRLIPDIFRSIDKNEQLIVRSINAIRPWQHVLDPLFGYIKVAELGQESLNYSLGWNFYGELIFIFFH